MNSTLTYRFEPEESAGLEAVRITVSGVTMKGIGTHARLTREAVEQWRTDTGQDKKETPAEAPPAEAETPENQPAELPAEHNWLYSQYTRWAVLATTTTRVSVIKRGKKPLELSDETPDDWPWQESSLAALGWDKPSGVGDVPVDLFTAWERAAMDVNPGVFGPSRPGSNAKKKTGLISVI